MNTPELEKMATHWIEVIAAKTMATIHTAENTDLEPLSEDDIKMIILIHANRLLESDEFDARRYNDIDDLIRVNNLHW